MENKGDKGEFENEMERERLEAEERRNNGQCGKETGKEWVRGKR